MHHKPKRRLGQNFLVDKNIQRKIIATCALNKSDMVIEIGAGRGELTRLIAPLAASVYALEIDPCLCRTLEENLRGYPSIKIVNRDILKFDLKKHFLKSKGRLKIIGNIPYYIATPIIQHLLKYKDNIEMIFITVQKEFGNRMTAVPGSKNYGSFSCYLEYHTRAERLFFIKNTCFFPRPKVDSSFIRLDIRRRPCVETKSEKLLFKIIRAAFNQRRKTLRNSLEGIIPQKKLKAFFDKYGISSNTRPEELSLQDFANLANI